MQQSSLTNNNTRSAYIRRPYYRIPLIPNTDTRNVISQKNSSTNSNTRSTYIQQPIPQMPNTDTSQLNSSNGRANENIPPVVDSLHEPSEYISNGTCLIFKFTSKI